MSNLFAIILLASELSFYLLVAQTGIIECFHSDLVRLFPLPIGGVLGSLVAYKNFGSLNTPKRKLGLFLALQLVISFGYPHYGPLSLFVLGISVGALAPLLIHLFAQRDLWQLTSALAIAYATGTSLFTTPPEARRFLAVALSGLALAILPFLGRTDTARKPLVNVPLPRFILLVFCVALDSSLFEMLSRSATSSIWRGEFWTLIVGFHLLGLAVAYATRDRHDFHYCAIALLFTASYGAYFLGELRCLAMIYPFTISYYTFFLMRALLGVRQLRTLGLYMAFAGWLASGIGLGVALTGLLEVPIVLLLLVCSGSVSLEFMPFAGRLVILRVIPFIMSLANFWGDRT